jgi:hypothetical protein
MHWCHRRVAVGGEHRECRVSSVGACVATGSVFSCAKRLGVRREAPLWMTPRKESACEESKAALRAALQGALRAQEVVMRFHFAPPLRRA